MCNPRRVEVTATRQIAEAWSREVRRAASHAGQVTGEARLRQPLDASVGAPALAALECALDEGFPGWTAVGGGYRHELQGGYAVYSPEDQTLEIVATAAAEVEGRGEGRATLGGTVEAEVQSRAEGRYYDDGWGGRTEPRARQEAQAAAAAGLERAARALLHERAQAAEAAQDEALRAQAQRLADEDFHRLAAERREALSREAAQRLGGVGVQARQAFHQLLARAYRDALLALARQRGASDVACNETGDYLDVEFMLPG